jgi:hypothetical protein
VKAGENKKAAGDTKLVANGSSRLSEPLSGSEIASLFIFFDFLLGFLGVGHFKW